MTQPSRTPLVNVHFRLSAAGSASSAEVSLRSFGDRWTAVAAIDGQLQHGLGRSAREALSAALVSLGKPAVSALLSDLALLAPSVEIARQERLLTA